MNRFLKTFANLLIPHGDNRFEPLLLRTAGFVLALLVLLGAAAGAIGYGLLLNRGEFLASVLPSVLVDLANADRADYGLVSLSVSPKLSAAAQMKADDMASKGYFAHVAPDGTTPWHWFSQAGYLFVYAGENLAVDFNDSSAVNAAWMNSSAHRANILGGRYTQIGIATARGTYEGRSTTFVVEEFASPAASASVATNEQALPAASTATATPPVQEQDVVPVVSAPAPQVADAPAVSGAETFVAVKSAAAAPKSEQGQAAAVPPARASSFAERFFSSPSTLLKYFYIFIGALLGIALAGVSLIEHPKRRRHLVELGVLFVLIIAAYAFVAFGVVSAIAVR